MSFNYLDLPNQNSSSYQKEQVNFDVMKEEGKFIPVPLCESNSSNYDPARIKIICEVNYSQFSLK